MVFPPQPSGSLIVVGWPCPEILKGQGRQRGVDRLIALMHVGLIFVDIEKPGRDLAVLLVFHHVIKGPRAVASVAHDIMMANEAGVFSVFAEYGTKRNQNDWDKLVRVTHWTDKDVAREAELRKAAKSVEAKFIAKDSFSEILIPFGLSQ
jgi:hypothetical protein